MATIKDIARACGVSHATVSNVLNHKGIVSAEKVKLVQDTARAMGYRLNEAASALRSGKARVLAVILPDTDTQTYDDLYRSLYQAAGARGYSTLLRLTGNVPAAERAAIADVLSARARYVVAVTSLPSPAEDYAELFSSGAEVAFALRGAPEGRPLMGFDMEEAARDMADRVLSQGVSRVGLMTGMLRYPSEEAFYRAFSVRMEASGVRLSHVQSIASQYGRQAFDLLGGGDMPDAVVTTGEEMARAVQRAAAFLEMGQPRVFSLCAVRLLPPRDLCRYALDCRRLGTLLCRHLMDGAPAPVRLKCEGFAVRAELPRCHRSVLNLLSNDSPFARALARLSPRFEADTGVRLTVTIRKTADVSHAFDNPETLRGFDMARMDMALLDRRARETFEPLEALPLDLAACDAALLDGVGREFGEVDGARYALPLDPSCHLLFYRRDLIENPHYQRRYFETYRENAGPLETYDRYLRAAQCLEQLSREEGVDRRGMLLTGRASECVGDLVSLSPDGRWPCLTRETIEAFLARRRGMESVALLVEDGSWNTAVRRFAQGRSALMIAHSNYALWLSDDPLSHVSGRVGFAPMPGKRPLLGGGALGALRFSGRKKEAAALLQWLFSPGARDLLALLGGCSPCRSVYENEEIADVYPWLETVRQGLQTGVRRKIFCAQGARGQMNVEQRIAEICQRAVRGEIDADETLARLNDAAGGNV